VPDNPRIEELRRRVQSDPASIAFAALAEEYRRAGRYEEAIATCAAGLKRHPSYLSAHVTLGRALIEVGRYEDAREELEFVLRAAPENLAAIRGLAEIHHRRGDAVYAPEDDDTYAEPEAVAPPASGGAPRPPAPQAAGDAASSEPAQAVLHASPEAPPVDPLVEARVRALEGFLAAIRSARGDAASPR